MTNLADKAKDDCRIDGQSSKKLPVCRSGCSPAVPMPVLHGRLRLWLAGAAGQASHGPADETMEPQRERRRTPVIGARQLLTPRFDRPLPVRVQNNQLLQIARQRHGTLPPKQMAGWNAVRGTTARRQMLARAKRAAGAALALGRGRAGARRTSFQAAQLVLLFAPLFASFGDLLFLRSFLLTLTFGFRFVSIAHGLTPYVVLRPHCR